MTDGRKDGRTEGRTDGSAEGRKDGHSAPIPISPCHFVAGDNNLVRCVTKLTDSLGQLNYIAGTKQTTGGLKSCTVLIFTLPWLRTCDLRRENTAKLTFVGECTAGIDGQTSLGPSKVP